MFALNYRRVAHDSSPTIRRPHTYSPRHTTSFHSHRFPHKRIDPLTSLFSAERDCFKPLGDSFYLPKNRQFIRKNAYRELILRPAKTNLNVHKICSTCLRTKTVGLNHSLIRHFQFQTKHTAPKLTHGSTPCQAHKHRLLKSLIAYL
jgi:hypothetical protein